MISSPLVSVIIPSHNRLELLNEAIQSVIDQSLSDWEIIVVDDCSTPPINPLVIQNTFGKEITVKYHPTPLGGAAAKNTGAMAASGKYIAFLDDDDLYDPHYLEQAISTLEQNSQIETLFMGVKWFGPNEAWAQNDYDNAMKKMLGQALGTTINETLLVFEERALFSALLKSVPMAFQRAVSLKQHFLNIGYYKPDCLLWDCDWAIRASLKGTSALLNDGLYLQRCAGQGYSSTPKRLIDHQLSNFELKTQLLNETSDPTLHNLIKQAIIQSGQALSWGYMNEKHHIKAFISILNTFKYGVKLSQFKFLLHNALAFWQTNRAQN